MEESVRWLLESYRTSDVLALGLHTLVGLSVVGSIASGCLVAYKASKGSASATAWLWRNAVRLFSTLKIAYSLAGDPAPPRVKKA